MGIGLVDPILPTMASQLHASPSQVSLLFTSYLLVTSVAMLVTGWVSSRIGAKKTLVTGLIIIVVFAALAGLSSGVDGIIGFRAGWGLGNALFIATSLAVIVGAASGGFEGAIMLYEAALGFGIALGPLVGGLLGGVSWRGPFFGVAVLMAIALIMVVTLLSPTPRPAQRTPLSAPVKALRHRGLLTVSLTALLYNWGFFTILGYAPYPMHIGVHQLGFVFFGWGLLVAIFAVFVAPRAERAIGTARSLYLTLVLMAIDVAAIAIWVERPLVVIVCVVISGAFIGMNNTLVTATVMSVSPVARPTASAAYSFVRFLGGGLAPWVAGILAAAYGDHLPFGIGAGAVLLGAVVLATAHRLINSAGYEKQSEPEEPHSPGVAPQGVYGAGEARSPSEGNVVYGHVRDARLTPLTGATLTLINHDGRQHALGVSGSDGRYALVGAPDGSFVLIAYAHGMRPEAKAVQLRGEPVALELELDGASVLQGTVVAAGKKWDSVTVTLVDTQGMVTDTDRTDRDGRYHFQGVLGGDYIVTAAPVDKPPAVQTVTVPEAGTVTVDIPLQVRTSVTGFVRRATDAAPVAEALVTLVDDTGNIHNSVISNDSGAYHFPEVDEGNYTLIASGYPPVRRSLAVRANDTNQLDIILQHRLHRTNNTPKGSVDVPHQES